ncbi:MAG: RNA-binding domain-containing protein [Pseudomonadota bacterium]
MKLAIYPERESKLLEFKERLPKLSSLVKTCVAFANGSGGKIVIGVEDRTRKIVGVDFDDIDRCYESFSNVLYDSVSPTLTPEIYEQNINGHNVIIIKINPGNKKPYLIKGEGLPKGVYIRTGSNTRRATDEYIEELVKEQKRINFDEELSGASGDELNEDLLKHIYGKTITDNLLLRERVLQLNSARQLSPTNAGLLIFGNRPEEHIPEASIICTVFRGTKGRDIIQTREILGPIPEILETSLQLISQWLEQNYSLSGSRYSGKPVIPIAALREAITNALIHRKYFIRGAVKVALFQDRLEVFNPGNFPGTISLENLGDGSTYLRNPLLAKFARKFKLIEKLGSGIRLIFEECAKASLKKPQYNEDGDFVKVTFFMQKEFSSDIPIEEKLKKLLEERETLRVHEALMFIDVSRNTITNAFNALIKKKLVKRIGKGRGAYYVKN